MNKKTYGISFRKKINDYVFYLLFTKVETIKGFDSLIDNDKHIVMIDCDNAILDNIIDECSRVQKTYNLGEMFIVADNKEYSYRVWCFKTVSFRELLKIIIDFKYADLLFIRFAAKRGKAVLRVSNKEGREGQKIVYTLEGEKHPIPENLYQITYETPRGLILKMFNPSDIG